MKDRDHMLTMIGFMEGYALGFRMGSSEELKEIITQFNKCGNKIDQILSEYKVISK